MNKAEQKGGLPEIFDDDARAKTILGMKDGRLYQEVLLLMRISLLSAKINQASQELPGRDGRRQTWIRSKGGLWEEVRKGGERGGGMRVEAKAIDEQNAVMQVIRALVHRDRWRIDNKKKED